MFSEAARNLISDPQLLLAAWQRFEAWASFDGWAPEPEYSVWRMDPDAQIVRLSSALSRGEWSPAPMRMLAYPKKGKMLRHYTQPQVETQVVFTALGILLAPILELGMHSFSFGNRWYRGIRRNVRKPEMPWELKPYGFVDRQIYHPYRRAYGLFRRVVHWSAKAMLGEDPSKEIRGPLGIGVDDLPRDALPDFIWPAWWGKSKGKVPRGYWCQFDLEMAYPSIRMAYLGNRIKELLDAYSESEDALKTRLIGYPNNLIEALGQPSTRQDLAAMLIQFLSSVRYDDKNFSRDLWVPPHLDHEHCLADASIGSKSPEPGLPTGLTISGLLLNVYLSGLDSWMWDWCDAGRKEKEPRGRAFFRFADDMIVLARTPEDTFEALDRLWGYLGRTAEAGNTSEQTYSNDLGVPPLAAPLHRAPLANLRINLSKVQPNHFEKTLREYLKQHGWRTPRLQQALEEAKQTGTAFPEEKDYLDNECCDQLCRPLTQQGEVLFLKDWSKIKDERLTFPADETLRSDELGQFVTYLVEHLSKIGQETAFDRFGNGARSRLDELHGLIRFNFDDQQVKTETLHSFAANKLSRAWLPEENRDEDLRLLREVRRSIAVAIDKTPWKSHLWRSAIRCAVRCSPTGGKSAKISPESFEMPNLLERLGPVGSERAWLGTWPESAGRWHQKCWTAPEPETERKQFWVSHHRAAVWRNLASVIRSMDALLCPDGTLRRENWTSYNWLFRALSESAIAPELTSLCRLDVWARKMYGATCDRPLYSWELEALCLAVLAASDRGQVLRTCTTAKPALASAEPEPGGSAAELLYIPGDLPVLDELPTVRAILEAGRRLRDWKNVDSWTVIYLMRRGSATVDEMRQLFESCCKGDNERRPSLRSRASAFGYSFALNDSTEDWKSLLLPTGKDPAANYRWWRDYHRLRTALIADQSGAHDLGGGK